MKIKINRRFWVTPNELLINSNITFKAKGIYAYIQSKPDDWDFAAARMAFESKDWRDGINAGLQELEEFWYLKRHKFKNEKGQWEIEYELYEEPQTRGENPDWTKQETRGENPATEKPDTEKPATNKTVNTKKEIINNKELCETVFDKIYFNIFWHSYKRKIDKGRAEKKFFSLAKQEKILAAAAAKKWTHFWEKAKKEIEFIPHPTTWLNNKRWEVEPPEIMQPYKKTPANAYQHQPAWFLDDFTF